LTIKITVKITYVKNSLW